MLLCTNGNLSKFRLSHSNLPLEHVIDHNELQNLCTSSRKCVMNHNWSARKQHLHLQIEARISRRSALWEDRIRQCGTSSESRRKDTDKCLQVTISYCRHRSVPVPCENGLIETTVASPNSVARLWDHTLGGNWPPEPTSSYASIDFWCQLVASQPCGLGCSKHGIISTSNE